MKGAFIFKHVFTKFFGLTKGRPVSFAYPTWSPKGSRRKGFFSDRGGTAGPVFVSGAAAATSSSLRTAPCLEKIARDLRNGLTYFLWPGKNCDVIVVTPLLFVPVVGEATVWWFCFRSSNILAQ